MINIGIIGAGIYGINHIVALKQREKYRGDINLIGFAEIDGAKREEIEQQYGIKGYADYKDMIRSGKPDALTVVTPDHLHHRIVMDCIGAIPVLVEKPLSHPWKRRATWPKPPKKREYSCRWTSTNVSTPTTSLKLRVREGELGKISTDIAGWRICFEWAPT